MSAFPQSGHSDRVKMNEMKGSFRPKTVEKLCFEKSDEFICDLSVISYARYERVVEVP